jgi:cytochrome P450
MASFEPAAAADPAPAQPSATAELDADALAGFDLRAPPAGFHDDPYRWYRALRRHAPVHTLPDGSLLLTRHADLMAVYRDARCFSSDKRVEFAPKYGTASLLFAHHTSSLVFNDPPLHTRVRRLIMGALTRRAIAEMEPGLVALVDRLLGQIAAQGGGDLIDDFAAAIPVEIIGNLLAVPLAERAPLRGWSLSILGALEPQLTPAQQAHGEQAVAEFLDYLRTLVAARRRRPGDPEHDVLTRLIQGDSEGERLSEHELLHNCIFLLNAGHETTTNLIGNALVLLGQQPQARARLLAEPQLIESAVEEFLRYESSNQLGNRRALDAFELGGRRYPAGTLLTLGIGAANRDPQAFDAPETLDLSRSPNRHLAFGFGPHQCAGLSLARLEGRVAIGRFVARFPRFRLTAAPLRGGRVRFRGFLHAPFAVE